MKDQNAPMEAPKPKSAARKRVEVPPVLGKVRIEREIVRAPGAWLFEADQGGRRRLLQLLCCRPVDDPALQLERIESLKSAAAQTGEASLRTRVEMIDHGTLQRDGITFLFWTMAWKPSVAWVGCTEIASEGELLRLGLTLAETLADNHSRGWLEPLLSEYMIAAPPGRPAEIVGVPVRVDRRWLVSEMLPARLAPEELLVREPSRAGDTWRLGQLLKALSGGLSIQRTPLWQVLERLSHNRIEVRARDAKAAGALMETLLREGHSIVPEEDDHEPVEPPSMTDQGSSPAEEVSPLSTLVDHAPYPASLVDSVGQTELEGLDRRDTIEVRGDSWGGPEPSSALNLSPVAAGDPTTIGPLDPVDQTPGEMQSRAYAENAQDDSSGPTRMTRGAERKESRPRSVARWALNLTVTLVLGLLAGGIAAKLWLRGRAAQARVPGVWLSAGHFVEVDVRAAAPVMLIAELDGRNLGAPPARLLIPEAEAITLLASAPGHMPVRFSPPSSGRLVVELSALAEDSCEIALTHEGVQRLEAFDGPLDTDAAFVRIRGAEILRDPEGGGAWLIACPPLGGKGRQHLRGRASEREVDVHINAPASQQLSLDGVALGPPPVTTRTSVGIREIVDRESGVRLFVPIITDSEIRFATE